MKSKLTESQHSDICKPINLLNKQWSDKNPPRPTQLNEKIRNTVKNNNPQVGERGVGEKDLVRNLTELVTRDRGKNYWGTYHNILT